MDDLQKRLQAALGSLYAIDRELGGGAMARVFVAEERSLKRSVVLKVLPPQLSAGVDADRFRREIALAAKLQHPHIVPLLSAGESDGLLYYTMPLVTGESLRARLDRAQELPIADAVGILRDIASALSYAHRCGVVHRDIKPDNVLLGEGGAIVSDFGVAKAVSEAHGGHGSLTGTGVSVGTPQYMAPEQVSADPHLDQRADIYAFGALAYEMLAGRTPLSGPSVQAVLAAHITQSPEPLRRYRPTVPAGLERTVMRCLEKRPADRPQSADELLRDLERTTELRPAPAFDIGLRAWKMAGVVVGVVLLVAVGMAVRSRTPRTPATPAPSPSVAALPFVNVSPDPQNEYFSDGMTDELINALSQLEEIRVTSRASSFALKGTKEDVRAIGRRLNVGAIVQGSVRRAGQRLRVTAQLVSVGDDATLWSHTYEGDVSDVFAVQDSIARAIAAALRVRLSANGGIIRQPTVNLEAYEWYLKGRYAWNLRTAASLRESIDYFQRAVARDSAFALAYSGIAEAYAILPTYDYFASPATAYSRAQAAALRALAIDSTLTEAETALGLSRQHAYDWAGAESAFKRALAINPRYATTHHWYAVLLWCLGRFDEAAGHINEASALDPASRVIALLPGIQRYYERDYDGAVAHYRKLLDTYPTYGGVYQFMALALAEQGKQEDALRATERAAVLQGWQPSVLHASVAFVHARSGDNEAARREVEEVTRVDSGPQAPVALIAAAYAALGDADRAVRWTERAVDEKVADVQYLGIDPRFDRVRSDPRFQRLFARTGLPPTKQHR